MQPRKQQHQTVASISKTAIAAATSKTISLDTKPTSEDSFNLKAAEMAKATGKRGRRGRLGRRMPRRKRRGKLRERK
jgi:hypothetical protein